MKSKYIPGPWKAVDTFIGTDDRDPQTIAYVSDHRNERGWTACEKKATAKLIAAAPSMASIIERLLSGNPQEVEEAKVEAQRVLDEIR